MCRRVHCRECGRPTFAGCGQHIEQVLGDVPALERCRCREAKPPSTGRSAAAPSSLGWIKKVLTK